MKHRGLKFLSLLLTLALLVGLLPGMTLTAYADPEVWSSNKTIDADQTISDGVNVIEAITLTINEGKKLTVNGGIYVSSTGALTVAGKGTLEVIGKTGATGATGATGTDGGNPGGTGGQGGQGGNGGIGIEGMLIVDGATVTVTGGKGGSGGIGGNGGTGENHPAGEQGKDGGSGGQGGTGGNGGIGIKGTVTVNSGSIFVTGGDAGDAGPGGQGGRGGTGSPGGSRGALGNPGNPGTPASAVSGQLPDNAQESDDGITWSAVTGGTSSKRYVKTADSFTVTYAPGDGASLKDGIQPPQGYTVDGQNIVKTGVTGEYQIEGLESCFNAPEGKVFDCWKDANGTEYRKPQTVTLTADLTLTAQWKDEEKPDDGEKKIGGSGSGFDIVFNIPGADNSWEYVGGGYAPQQAYRVSLAPMQGGSAALGLTTGDSGTQMNVYPSTTVFVFPNAEQGYTLDKIVWSLIDGSASYDITEAKNFVMPAMDAVVYVTFRPVG